MFTIRPLSRPTKTEQAFRIYLSLPALLSLKIRAGELCLLQIDDDSRGYALVHQSPEKLQDNIVQTSKTLQELYGLKLGDKIGILRSDKPLQSAASITLLDVTEKSPALSKEESQCWAWVASRILPSQHEVLVVNQKVLVEIAPGDRREFQVLQLDAASPIALISRDTKLIISQPSHGRIILDIPLGMTGGLSSQIQAIQKIMSMITGNFERPALPFSRTSPGIILYGASGTGKTLLIEQISKSGWRKVIHWRAGDRTPTITSRDQPSLVVIIGVDQNRESPEFASSIEKFLISTSGLQVLVLTETEHPNNLSASLRRPGRFGREIELPIPTSKDRLQILQALTEQSADPAFESWLELAASRTHGYVGVDLERLLEYATEFSTFRRGALQGHDGPERVDLPRPQGPQYELSDLEDALKQIRPSALQEVFLETPNVRWSDIRGQHEIKTALQQAVDWPLTKADQMKAVDIRPKKGILLYGPPGCSKTLLVKALATEAKLNFLAVKGAELISMYVGESERAVREVFRKARAASPSIVFFDEIDSIASRGKSELNVLTTLLNEMDGFEELRGVFVVAATNKPTAIDPALLRPGRLDNVVYVGLPDIETRREILKSWLGRIRADGIDLEQGVTNTEGFSGAEIIGGVCQSAGEYALQQGRDYITGEDFVRAIKATPRGVTREMLGQFEEWRASRL